MDKEKLIWHIKLCKKNLNNKRVKICAECAFEDDLIQEYPELKCMFEEKRKLLYGNR